MDTPDTLEIQEPLKSLDTLDTLTLARLDRDCQGPWEAEYSYGEEADLHRHYHNCTKNPGHKNFIPVDKFSIKDLPERYRDNDMVDFIRAHSDLTVRVTVKYVSERRPKTADVSGKPYLGYHCRGQRKTTVGTGWVSGVYIWHIWNDEMEERRCICKDCRKASAPHRKFAIIYINTAAHVVYDESECEHTTCHLFFDGEGTPETCKGVVALTEMECCRIDTKLDTCKIHHYTHDLELAERLEKRCHQRNHLRFKIEKKLLKTTNFNGRQPTLDQQPLMFIVSHPHGCSKQISIGRWTSSREHPNDRHSVIYTTATCPGCSGASVYLPLMIDSYGTMDCYSIDTTHVGVFDKPGMNFSYLSIGKGKYPYQYTPKLFEDF